MLTVSENLSKCLLIKNLVNANGAIKVLCRVRAYERNNLFCKSIEVKEMLRA